MTRYFDSTKADKSLAKLIANAKVEATSEIYEDFKEKMCFEMARNKQRFAKDDNGYYEGRDNAFRIAINYLAELTKKYVEEV